jgi:quercetin dioxygenase-like cupin family protein
MKIEPSCLCLCLTASLIAAGAVRAGEPATPHKATVASHIFLVPEQVVWGACPPALPPGAQCATVEGDPKTPNALFALRGKLPDGYQIPPHFHPADEHVVVLSGVLNMGLGDKLDKNATTALPAGGFMVMPAGHRHYAWAKGETIIQIYGIGPWGLTYVNPKDDPRNQGK